MELDKYIDKTLSTRDKEEITSFLKKVISGEYGWINQYWILRHKWITMEFVKDYPDIMSQQGWWALTQNPNLTIDIIKTFPDKPWDWDWMSLNLNLTIEMVETFYIPWNWNIISSNPNLTVDFINRFKSEDLDWNELSHNSNLIIELINEYSDESLDWDYMTRDPNITNDIIQENLDKPWDWKFLYQNLQDKCECILD